MAGHEADNSFIPWLRTREVIPQFPCVSEWHDA
jgi:hypothetical protein